MSKPNKLASSLAGLKDSQSTPATKIKADTGTTGGTKGKSADSNYTSTTVYLNKQTHAKAKAALLTDNAEAATTNDKRDLSDLIEQLLNDWLKARKV